MKLTICAGAAAALMLAAAPVAADTTHLYGVESITVIYDYSGSQKGTMTEHRRNWGHDFVQITNAEVRVFGMKQKINTRAVTHDDVTITYDLAAKTATRMVNPRFKDIEARVKGKDPKAAAEEMIRALGFTATNQTRTVAGETRKVWKSPLVETCFTDDVVTLATSASVAGVKVDMTAREVRRGDGGPDSAFSPEPGYKVQDAPDLSKILGR